MVSREEENEGNRNGLKIGENNMPKKEFDIGEEFQLGLVRLKCVSDHGCEDCYFNSIDYCYFVLKDIIGCCNCSDREDKTDVAFIKIEE